MGHSDGAPSGRQAGYTLGVVSFLNALPLIDGLDDRRDVRLDCRAPAQLAALLDAGHVDAALVPVVDLARRGEAWQRVSDACIASDNQTMTVRVFSRTSPERIDRLHVDGDSHTSVVLAKVIWGELYGRNLTTEPIDATPAALDACQAVLLIGDKVVSGIGRPFAFEVDLGAAWRELTGLPFVFAAWAARSGRDMADLSAMLSAARDRGVARADVIAKEHGPAKGWPVELAARYMTDYLSYVLTPDHLAGMARFIDLARRYGLLDGRAS